MLPEGWLVLVLGCCFFSLTLLIAANWAAGRSWRRCLVGTQEAGCSGGSRRSHGASLGCPYPPGEQWAELEGKAPHDFWEPLAADCSSSSLLTLWEHVGTLPLGSVPVCGLVPWPSSPSWLQPPPPLQGSVGGCLLPQCGEGRVGVALAPRLR